MTSRSTRLLVPLALLVLLPLGTSCVATRTTTSQGSQGDVSGGSRKRVIAKQPPETLLAADQTSCLVSRERFARVRLGEAVACEWR